MNLKAMIRRRRRPLAGLRIVTFNAWVGQKPENLRRHLRQLIRATGKPHILILQEVWRWSKGTIKGYTAIRPVQEAFDEDKSTIILVRNDAKILNQGSRRVPDGDWVWKAGPKPARVYPRVAVQFAELGPTVFNIIGVHRIPGGPRPHIDRNRLAWNKEHNFLVGWVKRYNKRHPRHVTVIGGDWNAGENEMVQYEFSLHQLAKDMGWPTMIDLKGIDGFFTINGESDFTAELERKFGSDGHQPVVTTIYPSKEAA